MNNAGARAIGRGEKRCASEVCNACGGGENGDEFLRRRTKSYSLASEEVRFY